jgi:hypothetical protein
MVLNKRVTVGLREGKAGDWYPRSKGRKVLEELEVLRRKGPSGSET